MDLLESVPLYLRQATADQNSAPQRNVENTEYEAIRKFLDMSDKSRRKEFDYFQSPEIFGDNLFNSLGE